MSTWHQDQAARRAVEAGQPLTYAHPTLWTVIDNPIGGMTSVARFKLPEEAQREADRINRSAAPLRYLRAYVLPPTGQAKKVKP